jgi:subtilase family serine protease
MAIIKTCRFLSRWNASRAVMALVATTSLFLSSDSARAGQIAAQIKEERAHSATSSNPVGNQQLHGHRTVIMSKAPVVGRLEPATKMHLAIGLPLRNQAALTTFISQIYDPKNPQYRRYLTVEQFAEAYGPTKEDYGAVLNFAKANGFKVNNTFASRSVVSVTGTAEQVEKTFHVQMNKYKRADGTIFHAPDREPSLDFSVPILRIGGLGDFVLPKAPVKLVPVNREKNKGGGSASKREGGDGDVNSPEFPKKGTVAPPTPPLQGSDPNGGFGGNDFKNAYAPGSNLNGAGQCVALAEYGGYYPANIANYAAFFQIHAVPIHPVYTGGVYEAPNPMNESEVALDIEMAMAMAQGLNSVEVIMGPEKDSVFSAIASPPAGSPLCYQASSSYPSPIDDIVSQALAEMAAQGQSFFQATGDTGAFQADPGGLTSTNYVTLVGGTELAMTGSNGTWTWQSEIAWAYGGGGIESDHSIPSFQRTVNMTENGGSTKSRNAPDVAMDATGITEIFGANSGRSLSSGTSAAAPLWAGFMALANQQAANNKIGPVGFANPALYAIGSNPVMYAKDFHDIQSGRNNKGDGGVSLPISFAAVPGYDLVTGWGTPQANLINDLSPVPAAPPTLYTLIEFDISTGGDGLARSSAVTATFVDANGNPFQTATLKAEGSPAWEPNTRHVVNATLVTPLAVASFAHIVVNLAANDSWDINRMNIRLSTVGAATCLVDLAGTPLVHLTANQVESFTPRSGCQP